MAVFQKGEKVLYCCRRLSGGGLDVNATFRPEDAWKETGILSSCDASGVEVHAFFFIDDTM